MSTTRKNVKVFVGNVLPKDFLSYTAVVIENTAYHSSKFRLPVFQDTKRYCHKCFKVLEDGESHDCFSGLEYELQL